jgi:hypothetical protein
VTDRELDEAVAVKVMGWEVSPVVEGSPYHGGSYVRQGPMWHRLFNPSTDIAEAWRVVERMRELGFWVSVEFDGIACFCAWFGWGSVDRPAGQCQTGPECANPTAPRAICEAALAALGAT